MRVRVYDAETGEFFLSELYAVINSGVFERCLVVRDGRLQFYPRFIRGDDMSDGRNGDYHTAVSDIEQDLPNEWVHLTNGDLEPGCRFPKQLPEDRWDAFRGYPWVWENQALLLRLMDGAAVPLEESGYPPVSSLLPGWNYVTDNTQAEALMKQAHHFHDTVLVTAHYISGAEKAPDGGLRCCDCTRQVTMLFHCDWTPSIEMVFEAVRAFDLRPGDDNDCSALIDATCRIKNGMVFFADEYCEPGEEENYPRTCIWSYSMRWRFCSEDEMSH